MGEEKDDKKSWWQQFRENMPNLVFQMKNQIAEKLPIKLTFNINTGTKIETVNIQPSIPSDTNLDALAQILGKYYGKPKVQKVTFTIPPGKNIKWVTDQLNTAVNSSAITLSTMANIDIEGTVKHKKVGHGEGTDTVKPIDLTPKSDKDVDEGEGI
jgi:hypothetical protein